MGTVTINGRTLACEARTVVGINGEQIIRPVPVINGQQMTGISINGYNYPPAIAGAVLHLPGLPGQGTTLWDGTGNGNNGTITGATWVQLPSGLWGLKFGGVSDYVNCGAGASLDVSTGDLTVMGWVWYDTQVEDSAMPINKGGESLAVAGYEFEGGTTASGNAEKPYFRICDGGGVAGDSAQTARTAALNDGKWHLLTGTVDRTAATINIYVDGALISSVAIPGTVGSISNAAQALNIGGRTTAYNFKGKIQGVRVFKNVALSLSQIAGVHAQERSLFGV